MNCLIKLYTAIIIIIIKHAPFNEWVDYSEQAACTSWQLGL